MLLTNDKILKKAAYMRKDFSLFVIGFWMWLCPERILWFFWFNFDFLHVLELLRSRKCSFFSFFLLFVNFASFTPHFCFFAKILLYHEFAKFLLKKRYLFKIRDPIIIYKRCITSSTLEFPTLKFHLQIFPLDLRWNPQKLPFQQDLKKSTRKNPHSFNWITFPYK